MIYLSLILVRTILIIIIVTFILTVMPIKALWLIVRLVSIVILVGGSIFIIVTFMVPVYFIIWWCWQWWRYGRWRYLNVSKTPCLKFRWWWQAWWWTNSRWWWKSGPLWYAWLLQWKPSQYCLLGVVNGLLHSRGWRVFQPM